LTNSEILPRKKAEQFPNQHGSDTGMADAAAVAEAIVVVGDVVGYSPVN
jgi:hypothetical protein